MPDAMRDVPPSASAPATAKRGRRDERLLSKLRLAALVAREHGVIVRVHGIEICSKRKSALLQKEVQHQVQQKPAVSVAPTQHPSTTGAASPSPPSPRTSRQRRSSQRLLAYQEKKRAAAVQEFVSRGVDPVVARGTVERAELKRLERIAAARASPMEAEASVGGRPPGEEGPPCGERVGPKRARASPPDVGRSASSDCMSEAARGGPRVPNVSI